MRTTLQTEADKIDRDLNRLVLRLERLAKEHNLPILRCAYRSVEAARSDVRQCMHEDDRKATTG